MLGQERHPSLVLHLSCAELQEGLGRQLACVEAGEEAVGRGRALCHIPKPFFPARGLEPVNQHRAVAV